MEDWPKLLSSPLPLFFVCFSSGLAFLCLVSFCFSCSPCLPQCLLGILVLLVMFCGFLPFFSVSVSSVFFCSCVVLCWLELAPSCWSFDGDSTIPFLCFTLPLVFFFSGSSFLYLLVRPLLSLMVFSCPLLPWFFCSSVHFLLVFAHSSPSLSTIFFILSPPHSFMAFLRLL